MGAASTQQAIQNWAMKTFRWDQETENPVLRSSITASFGIERDEYDCDFPDSVLKITAVRKNGEKVRASYNLNDTDAVTFLGEIMDKGARGGIFPYSAKKPVRK